MIAARRYFVAVDHGTYPSIAALCARLCIVPGVIDAAAGQALRAPGHVVLANRLALGDPAHGIVGALRAEPGGGLRLFACFARAESSDAAQARRFAQRVLPLSAGRRVHVLSTVATA